MLSAVRNMLVAARPASFGAPVTAGFLHTTRSLLQKEGAGGGGFDIYDVGGVDGGDQVGEIGSTLAADGSVSSTAEIEVKAVAKQLKTGVKKMWPFTKLIAGEPLLVAMWGTRDDVSKHGRLLYQVLKSAAGNAQHNHGIDPDYCYVSEAWVTKGQMRKKIRYHAKGRYGTMHMNRAHVTVVLKEIPKGEEAPPQFRKWAERVQSLKQEYADSVNDDYNTMLDSYKQFVKLPAESRLRIEEQLREMTGHGAPEIRLEEEDRKRFDASGELPELSKVELVLPTRMLNMKYNPTSPEDVQLWRVQDERKDTLRSERQARRVARKEALERLEQSRAQQQM